MVPNDMQQLNKTPLIVWQSFKAYPSKATRDKICAENMGLVWKVAHAFANKCNEPFEDLEQLGTIGLLKAIDKYDLSTGYAFSSIAIPTIRSEILHYLRDNRGITKVSRQWQELFNKVAKLKKEFAESGRHCELKECAIALEIDPEEWEVIEEAVKFLPHTELEKLPSEPHSSEYLPDALRKAIGKEATRALAHLSSQAREAVLRHIVYGDSEKKLAKELGISTEEIRVLIDCALAILRDKLENSVYAIHTH